MPHLHVTSPRLCRERRFRLPNLSRAFADVTNFTLRKHGFEFSQSVPIRAAPSSKLHGAPSLDVASGCLRSETSLSPDDYSLCRERRSNDNGTL